MVSVIRHFKQPVEAHGTLYWFCPVCRFDHSARYTKRGVSFNLDNSMVFDCPECGYTSIIPLETSQRTFIEADLKRPRE